MNRIHSAIGSQTINFSDGTLATGKHGKITVNSGTVNIEDIYEDDDVSGVTTYRGVDKGLNLGSGNYDPKNGNYIDCTSFTVESGAVLTHGLAYGAGLYENRAIIWIVSMTSITVLGEIDLEAIGFSGGVWQSWGEGKGRDGYGPGGGGGGYHADVSTGGSAGSTYGDSNIPTTTWENLYGSGGGAGGNGDDGDIPYYKGGGGGGAGHAEAGDAGTNGPSTSVGVKLGCSGGTGGGALRLYADNIYLSEGSTNANGGQGSSTPPVGGSGNNFGCGGGGAGGTIYIESLTMAELGTDKITASAGLGGSTDGTPGGDGAIGRIHVVGDYTGSTSDPVIA